MARVALGQGKMVARPVAGVMHILIYVGLWSSTSSCSKS